MPKGGKHRFTVKEDALAKTIAREYIQRGFDTARAKAIGYATVNKIREIKGRKHLRLRNVKVGKTGYVIRE